jgi:hypothetical protein
MAPVLAALQKSDKADLDAALANPIITGAAIARGLSEILETQGIKVSAETVNRHRKGECGCAR